MREFSYVSLFSKHIEEEQVEAMGEHAGTVGLWFALIPFDW